MKGFIKIAIILIVTFCFSSCSWGILLVIGNNSEKSIQVVYQLPPDEKEPQFFKKPKTFAFDKKILKVFKRNEKKRPIELINDAEYNDQLKTITLTIKPGEASMIGHYYSFQSFENEIINSNLKIRIDKDSVINTKESLNLFRYWNRRTSLLEVK